MALSNNFVINIAKIPSLIIGSKVSTIPASIINFNYNTKDLLTVREINRFDNNIVYYTLVSDISDNIFYVLSTDAFKKLILNGYLTIIDINLINITKINNLIIGSTISTMPITINNLLIVTEIYNFNNITYYTLVSNTLDNVFYILSNEAINKLIINKLLKINE